MKQLLTLGSAAIAVAISLPAVAWAQASAAPYTSATRYDSMGRVTGTIAPDPDGTGALKYLATRTTYDAAGRPVKVESGELSSWQSESIAPSSWSGFSVLRSVETTFDVMGRKLTEKALGSDGVAVGLTQYSYDAVGRLECVAVRMNTSAYSSLPSSACTLGTQGSLGPDRISRTYYNNAGDVLQVRKAVGTSIEIADVTYSHTSNGKVREIVDANGNRAEMRYDDYDRHVRWVFPSDAGAANFNNASQTSALNSAGSLDEGLYESYTYDANGNRTSLRKRDGSTLNYQYDNLNRMTRKTVPERTGLASVHTRDVFYSYDLRGLQLRARFNNISSYGNTFVYDGFGRLIHAGDNEEGTYRSLDFQYDANGNRTRITHPDGQYWTFDRDGLNRLTNVRQGGTIMGAYTYNSRGLPFLLTWSYATSSWNRSTYNYDNAGRLASTVINLNGTSRDNTWSYTRNPALQIRTETQTNDAYSWDGHATISRAYTTNGLNQYESAGGASFCYDANGNLTADGASVYLYDIENRLVQQRAQTNTNCLALSYTGTLQAELRYDPLGRLYRVTGGAAGVQHFLHDGNALVAEYNNSGTLLRRYVHGSNVEADDPLIWYEGSAVTASGRRYLHSDPRGSIVAVTNYQGTSIATNTYDEYGIPDDASGNDIATKGRFRYTGQAWIPELGMYYYKARIYSPTLGRFLQTDPIGYEDQYNLYAYVGNDPINAVDPSGNRKTRNWNRIHGLGAMGVSVVQSSDGTGGETANATPDGGGSQGTSGMGHNNPPSSTTLETEGAGQFAINAREPKDCGVVCKIGRALGIYEIGAAGEAAVKEKYDIGEKVRIPMGDKIRIPDGLTAETLSEVKNVGRLSYTAQLRAYAQYSKQNGLTFNLYIRGSTIISGPLFDAAANGDIRIRLIPGT